jgi:integrase
VALRWLEKASLPVSEVGKPEHARAALDALSVLQDGRAASATTISRKRSVFANVLRYAVELEELPTNPLDRLSWKPPKVSEVVDRRVVVNPSQARGLLTAVTYVGQQRRGSYARVQRLMALYACMYFAALRPGEAVALGQQDAYLPASGWGRLILEKSRPEVNRRWTDTASAHEERGLKHRPVAETRRYPSRRNWSPSSATTLTLSASPRMAVSSAANARIRSPPPPSATSGPRLEPWL